MSAAYLWGPYSFSQNEVPHWDPSIPEVADINEIKDQVPDDVVLSAYHSFVPHVGRRERIYMWPTPFKSTYYGPNTIELDGTRLPFADEVEYIMLPASLDADQQAVFDGIADDYELVDENDTARLYKRKDLPDPES